MNDIATRERSAPGERAKPQAMDARAISTAISRQTAIACQLDDCRRKCGPAHPRRPRQANRRGMLTVGVCAGRATRCLSGLGHASGGLTGAADAAGRSGDDVICCDSLRVPRVRLGSGKTPSFARRHSRRTGASRPRAGGAGRSISCTRPFWSRRNGGRPPRSGLRGVSRQHEQVVEFAARQILDTVAPSNFIPTNPENSRADICQRRQEPHRRLCQLSRRIANAPSPAASRLVPKRFRYLISSSARTLP